MGVAPAPLLARGLVGPRHGAASRRSGAVGGAACAAGRRLAQARVRLRGGPDRRCDGLPADRRGRSYGAGRTKRALR